MYREDQIKGTIALILFAAIGLTYWLFEEEVAKVVAVIALVIWLATMFLINKKNF